MSIESNNAFILENAKRMAESIRCGDLLIGVNQIDGQPLSVDVDDANRIWSNTNLRPFFDFQIQKGELKNFSIEDVSNFTPEAYIALDEVTKTIPGKDGKPSTQVKLFRTSVSETLQERAWAENKEFDRLHKYIEMENEYKEKMALLAEKAKGGAKGIAKLAGDIGRLEEQLESVRMDDIRRRLQEEFNWTGEPRTLVPQALTPIPATSQREDAPAQLTERRLKKIEVHVEKIERLKPEDVPEMEPTKVLGRLIADVHQKRLDRRAIPLLEKRFGSILRADGSIDDDQLQQVVANLNRYWTESPLQIGTIPVSELPVLPETIVSESEILEIQSLVDQVQFDIAALRGERAGEVLNRSENYAVLLRSVFNGDELREISEMLGNEYNTFRLIRNGTVLSREESFDMLVNAYGTIGRSIQRELINLFHELYEKRRYHGVAPSYDWLTQEVSYCAKPEIYKNPQRYGEFTRTTIFELAELAEGKNLAEHQYDSDFGRRRETTTAFYESLKSSIESLEQIEPAFREFYTHVSKAIEIEKKDYLQAIVAAKRAMEKNEFGWRHMKKVAYAMQHLIDIRDVHLRDSTHIEAGKNSAPPTLVFNHVLPEVVTRRFLENSWRQDGVVVPDPFSEEISLDDEQVLCLIGANGGGKSTFLKQITSPLPSRAGKIGERGEIKYQPQGVTLNGDASSQPHGFIEADEVTDSTASHFQKRAQFMLDALLARDGRRVIMDEGSGTSPDWGVTLDVMLQLLGVDRSTHSPIEVNTFMKTFLGDRDYARKVLVRCMVNHKLRDNELITLSGGAQLALLTGPTPEFYAHLSRGVAKAGLPVAEIPEYEIVASYLANINRDKLPYISPEDLDYLGFGTDGEITAMVSRLLGEGFKKFNVPGREQININVSHLKNHMIVALHSWVEDQTKIKGRQALMKSFLPQGEPWITRKSTLGQLADHVPDEMYFTAIDALQPELREHYQHLGALSLLPPLLKGDPWAALRVLEDVTSFNQGALREYCQELGQTGFFTPQGRLLLDKAPSMLGGLSKFNRATLKPFSGSERPLFQHDVEGIIRTELRLNARNIVGITSPEESTITQLNQSEQELLKKREELAREKANFEEMKKSYDRTVLAGFFEGLSDAERSLVEEIYGELAEGISGTRVSNLQSELVRLLYSKNNNRHGYNVDTSLQALYLVLTRFAGDETLGQVIGAGYWNNESGRHSRKGDIDDTFGHSFYNAPDVSRKATHPKMAVVIDKCVERLKRGTLQKRSAALLTGKFLGMVASSIPTEVMDRKVQTTAFMIDYLRDHWDTRALYTQEMVDYANLIDQKRSFSFKLKTLEDGVSTLEKENQVLRETHAEVFKKLEALTQFQALAESGRLTEIVNTYRKFKKGMTAAISSTRLQDLDSLISVITVADPTIAIRSWLEPRLSEFGVHAGDSKRLKSVNELTTADLVGVMNKLSSGSTPMREVIERYIARTTQAELKRQGSFAMKDDGINKISDDMTQAVITLGFAAAFREMGQYGEGSFGGDAIAVEGGVNLQVLARMGEEIAKKENHPSMSQRAKIRRAMREWKLMSGKIDADIAIIQDRHGGKKTTGLTMNGANMVYTKAWKIGPYGGFAAPDVAALRFLKDEGTGQNLSAHQRFVFGLRDALWDMRQFAAEGKRVILFGDEVGQGTNIKEGQLEVDAALRTIREYGGYAEFISQDPGMVIPARDDAQIGANIIGISDTGEFIRRNTYVELDVPAALEMKGFPKSGVDLARRIYEIRLRAKQSSALN